MILAELPSRGCRLACDCTVHYLLLLLLDLTKVVCCPKRLRLPDLDRPTQQAKQLASLLAVQPACTVAACKHSPAPSSLQQFPHRALVRDLKPRGCRELVLDGYMLPKGTLVNVPFYLVHRQPEAYPEPEEFLPDRWLSDGTSVWDVGT